MLLVVVPVAIAAPTTPTADFTDNGDGTVTHKTTGLTWMRCAMGMTWTGTTCTGTASTYTWDQARVVTTTFAGKSDWRLPSIAELNSIVERDAYNPAINTTQFPNTPVSFFWSASAYANGSSGAWSVLFLSGFACSNQKCIPPFHVRLVRAGQSIDPLALYTPTADFIDNGDGTATHRKTGLMWKRCAEGQTWNDSTCSGSAATYDWNTAVALTSSSAGYNDWRLPTANELATIVEYRAYRPAINETIFPNTSASYFWSASADAYASGSAWSVGFDDGFVGGNAKGGADQVRLVRAGQSFSTLGFPPQSGVAPNATVTSNSLRITGISASTPISIVGGSYAIGGGAYTTARGTANPNDSVTVRVTASPSPSTTTRATLTVGGVSGDFSVTTGSTDSQAPDVPSNLTARAGGDSNIDLAWSAARDNIGVTAYQLYRNGNWLTKLGNVTSYRDVGLSAATTYTYRLTACDAVNNCSAQSAAATASTLAAHVFTQTTRTADFTDNGDGTVTHKTTGLIWMRCAMGQTWDGSTCTGTARTYTWDQAVALTANFAGKSDWRLPSIMELSSIVEIYAYDPAINSTIFPNTSASFFWSASADAVNSGNAWFVYFYSGYAIAGSKAGTYQVRLVRAGQSFDPLALSTPTADFIDNGDGTVTHRKTGLMWKRCGEGQTWSGSTCSGIAATYDWNTAVALTSSGAGYNDWRLPAANELVTIVEYQALNPAINTTIFPNTSASFSASYFWSASAGAGSSGYAWVVRFGDGHYFAGDKSSSYQVRLVRAGQIFGTLGFAPQSGVAPNAVLTSNSLRITGISASAPISIVGGSYAINGGAYTSARGTANPNDSVTVRVAASPSPSTTTRATLTVGSVSGDFSVTTLADTQPPLAPRTLTATGVGSSQVNLIWSAASDGVISYRLYRNGVLLAVVGNVTSYTDTKLVDATRFNYTVAACDVAGNCSAPSGVATATISGSVKTLPLLAAGANHSAALRSDGRLWTWGDNDSGQLGTGATADSSSRPQSIGNGFIAVAMGGSHSVAIKADGSLWTWGANASGQLGNGTTTSRSSPAQIGTGYVVVAAGNAHTLAIKNDGSLWVWGNNGSGRVGDGTTNQRDTPTRIGTGFYAVAAGTSHSVALKIDGSLWAWGSNNYGQLGDETGNDRYAPTFIGTGFTAVAAGAFHTIALKTDGSLWAWGQNDAGQLGDSTGQRRYVPARIGNGYTAVAAGTAHTIALKTDGSVWAWGSNVSGQLGDGTMANRFDPIQVPGLSGVVAVAAGGDHNLALKADGTVMSWGANNAGQLGDGTYAPRSTFAAVVNETVTGILDLDTAVQNRVPASAIPKIIMEARKTGSIVSLTLGSNVYFGAIDLGTLAAGSFAAGGAYKVFVGAIVPAGIPGKAAGLYLLEPNGGWSYYAGGPLREYVANATLDQTQHSFVPILANTDLSGLVGTRFLVGYGTDDQEMLAAQRYRDIYVVQADPTQ